MKGSPKLLQRPNFMEIHYNIFSEHFTKQMTQFTERGSPKDLVEQLDHNSKNTNYWIHTVFNSAFRR